MKGDRDIDALAGSLVDRARSWAEFRTALARWRMPARRVVYADVDGNVGFQDAALIPLRLARPEPVEGGARSGQARRGQRWNGRDGSPSTSCRMRSMRRPRRAAASGRHARRILPGVEPHSLTSLASPTRRGACSTSGPTTVRPTTVPSRLRSTLETGIARARSTRRVSPSRPRARIFLDLGRFMGGPRSFSARRSVTRPSRRTRNRRSRSRRSPRRRRSGETSRSVVFQARRPIEHDDDRRLTGLWRHRGQGTRDEKRWPSGATANV